ncbi:FtsX-like permease family protein [Granulosicoccus antarcticus]|uniref:ABC3 transporter permease C-terminal domain-containing protein n=1 Tax=Granulosicoccus antarcticus IMCC3135 TaxID=1192854 RepID=A0A2Z2P174_9GAMM|nr:ABC transporter permease [Granulosicoccus antarcticus]ASJ73284.1 hypothetical protein IMCC3135_16010 [Granulosicoccus antarcticus IMCC3135]
MNVPLIRWLAISCWRQQPGPLLAAVFAIAMGVSLGLGINLVNASALSEFDDAISLINGDAQYQLTGALDSIDDEILSVVEQDPDVVAASPIISMNLPLSQAQGAENLPESIPLIALDIFRAAKVAPSLLPRADESLEGGAGSAVFSDEAIFLSAAAQREFQRKVGESLPVLVNGQVVQLIVSGDVPGVDDQTSIAIMDIGAAQWRLGWLGKLSRIDLRLAEGVDPQAWLARVQEDPLLATANVRLDRPDSGKQRMSNLSRAYRVNLNVLALVALLTGGFIVFATLDLAVTRLIPTLSLVSVMGATSAFRLRLVLILSVVLGVLGALLGIGLGIALAWALLGLVGGDLGGGFFAASRPSLSLPVSSLTLFFMLGVIAAVAGGLSPALKLRHLSPAQALKGGQSLILSARLSPLWISLSLFVVGTGLLFLPAINGLPIAAYLAIACWLFAGVLVVSPLLGVVAKALSQWRLTQRRPMLMMAVMRLNSAHQRAFPALAGVVASFALVCAMAMMVFSFRVSVDEWLEGVLPASLYVRVPTTGANAAFSATDRDSLSAIEGISKIQFARNLDLVIDPERPSVELVARTINTSNPDADLPITGTVLALADKDPECTLIYVSEPASVLYQWGVGDHVSLPLSSNSVGETCFQVGGIWRDYASQSGAIAISREDYVQLSGDESVSGASIWLDDGVNASQVVSAIRTQLGTLSELQIRSAEDIRALSLHIFDRSFAVTYVLEAVALLVSLFGVATTYSGEALSRTREFGMLRHLGVTRRQISALFVYESLFCISLGVLWGALLGAAISQVLIQRVNPQSFNWTMQTHWPLDQLSGAAMILVVLGAFTATIAARKAAGRGPIEAVRTDW